jgi:signal transduction histidine kinase
MNLRQWKAYIFPGAAEADEGFRQQIQKLSLMGLRVAGGVMIGGSLVLTLARFVVDPEPETLSVRMLEALVVLALGAGSFFAPRLEVVRKWSRLAACVSALVLTAVLVFFSLLLSLNSPRMEDYIPAQVTLVMLVMLAAVPLRPAQALGLGLCMSLIYVAATTISYRWLQWGSGPIEINLLFIVMLSLLSAGVAAVVYRQRFLYYQSYIRSLKAVEELREAEARMLVVEQSAMLTRLVAALSHEMNSPMGALRSAVDTVLLLCGRDFSGDEKGRERTLRVMNDLRKSIHKSAGRLSEILARMQRISNLDKAEIGEACVNEMIEDAIALVSPVLQGRAAIQSELEPLPRIVCRPAQLSAVFHGLISNAANAVENGGGRILVSSRPCGNGLLEVLIEDNGRGIPAPELATIFEMQFQVAENRVRTGNWWMFTFRRIVRQHGGDIAIESSVGVGTKVRVSLPCETPLARELT